MGIKNLTTITKEDKCYQEVEFSNTDNCSPNRSIAIDGNGLMHYILPKVEWRLGCSYQQTKKAFIEFLQPFLQNKIKLHIFIDGLDEDAKKETKKDRILQVSTKGLKFHEVLGSQRKLRLFSMYKKPFFFEDILKDAIRDIVEKQPNSITVTNCVSEADPVIANFASTTKDVC